MYSRSHCGKQLPRIVNSGREKFSDPSIVYRVPVCTPSAITVNGRRYMARSAIHIWSLFGFPVNQEHSFFNCYQSIL